MKRTRQNSSQKKTSTLSTKAEEDIQKMVDLFKSTVREYLSQMTNGGMSPSQASIIIIHKLISSDTIVNFRENIQDIQSIQFNHGGTTEEAFYALIIQNEIIKLRKLGLTVADAIHELTNRLNYKKGAKEKKNKKRTGDNINNDHLIHLKKPKTKDSKEKAFEISSPNASYVNESLLASFNPFKTIFKNEKNRLAYFQTHKVKFLDGTDSSSEEEDMSSGEYINEKDDLNWIYNAFNLDINSHFDPSLILLPSNMSDSNNRNRRQMSMRITRNANPVNTSIHSFGGMDVDIPRMNLENHVRNHYELPVVHGPIEIDEMETASSQFSSDSDIVYHQDLSYF